MRIRIVECWCVIAIFICSVVQAQPAPEHRSSVAGLSDHQIEQALQRIAATTLGGVLVVDCHGNYDHSTIQAAIDAAGDGDVVVVLPNNCAPDGRYHERIDFLGKAITVRSVLPEDPAVVDSTIIDGDQEGDVVSMLGGEGLDSTLLGLTITNGSHRGVLCFPAGPTIRYCNVTDNGNAGIELYNEPEVLPTAIISHCRVSDNSTTLGGGINVRRGTYAIVTNCELAGNSASFWGAGINVTSSSQLHLRHCTLTNNTAGVRGGGLYVGPNSSAIVEYSILWGNAAGEEGPEIAMNGLETSLSVTFSDVQGGLEDIGGDTSGLTWGSGNLVANPLFKDHLASNYRLAGPSPCVNAGDTEFVPEPGETDIAGNPRVLLDRVDLGAHEAQMFRDCNDNGSPDWQDIAEGSSDDEDGNGYPDECPTIFIYVDDDAPGDPGPGDPGVSDPAEDGSSDHPYDTIQKAISAAALAEVVVVAEGTYAERINYAGRAITVQSVDPDDPAVVAATVIDGHCDNVADPNASVVSFVDAEGPASVLDGLTVTGGCGTLLEYLDLGTYHFGGGILCRGSSPTIRRCRVVGNQAEDGGGVAVIEGHAVIHSCQILGNVAQIETEPAGGWGGSWVVPGGGGVYLRQSSAEILFSNIEDNMVDALLGPDFLAGVGAGVAMVVDTEDDLALNIQNSVVRGNEINGQGANYFSSGGGIGTYNADLTVRNVLIEGNRAPNGAGLFASQAATNVFGSTIAGNSYDDTLGNGLDGQSAVIDVHNTVVFGNTPVDVDSGSELSYTIAYSNIGATSGVDADGPGNISVDPLFVNPAAGDYHLSSGSVCIDAGDPDFVPQESETDLDGQPRVINDVVDMGADEFSACSDFNGDDLVGPFDLAFLLAAWGLSNSDADLDGDGTVDAADLALLLAQWGACP